MNFDLLWIEGIPYDKQPLTRFAEHMTKGAGKYGKRNFEKASGREAFVRYRESLRRHFNQWWCGERDEDHLAAVMFNCMALMMMEARDGVVTTLNHTTNDYDNTSIGTDTPPNVTESVSSDFNIEVDSDIRLGSKSILEVLEGVLRLTDYFSERGEISKT